MFPARHMGFDLHAAVSELHGRGPLLILPHDNPDPDSLAAALGLQRVAASVGCSSEIALGGIIGRAENRALVRELAIPLRPLAEIEWDRFPLIAVVDTQPQTGNNSLPPGRTADIVIDHHPPRMVSLSAPWCDIREDAGASSVIVLEYLRALGLDLDARLATAFLYALKSETRDLGREAGPRLREAYVALLALADHQKLYRITHPKLGREHFAAVDRALRSAEVRGSIVTANLGTLDYPDLVAEVADLLLSYDRARWVLCVGRHQGHVNLSIRTDIPDAHAGHLIRRLLGTRGAGGGHGMIAGGRLFEEGVDAEGLARIHADLIARLTDELHETAAPVPLL